jgi:hypothetical protein
LTIEQDESDEAKELIRRSPPARAVPIVLIIVGTMAVPLVVQMIREALRQIYYGRRDLAGPGIGRGVADALHGHFNYDWTTHLGPIYVGTIIYVVGVVIALVRLSQAEPAAAQARR